MAKLILVRNQIKETDRINQQSVDLLVKFVKEWGSGKTLDLEEDGLLVINNVRTFMNNMPDDIPKPGIAIRPEGTSAIFPNGYIRLSWGYDAGGECAEGKDFVWIDVSKFAVLCYYHSNGKGGEGWISFDDDGIIPENQKNLVLSYIRNTKPCGLEIQGSKS